MENAQSEQREDVSFEQNISQDFNTNGHSGFHHQTFGQERGGSAFPLHRLVTLGLLNAVLLIAAVVIGIYCSKGDYLQVPHSAATPLIFEMDYLRNHSDVIIRAKLDAQAQLVKVRAGRQWLELQVMQTKTLNDHLQRQIETLQTQRTTLQYNKTTIEESCGRCPKGWSLLKSSCYYFSHHVSNSKKNWLDSRANCISQGGDLLVINNLEEQQLISDNFPKVRSSLWWQNGYWIGLTNVGTAGTWVWVNNVTEVETMYWRHGHPATDGLLSGNCAAFIYFAMSMSMVRPESIWNHYKVLTVSLAVLAAMLLAVDIGLGVYYSKLTDGQHVMDISNEVDKLQATYSDAIKSRGEAKKQLASVISQQEFTKWEIEQENKRSKSFEKLSDKIQPEVAVLKSHISMIKEGCRRCLPGWTFMNSLCYYFAFLDTLSRRSWREARQFCTKRGGDLAVIDNRQTHLAISKLINNFQDHAREISISGFWIGLTDVEQEGTWKWLDGRKLNEGFWNNGEPNNSGNEDCAAAYPRSNPLLSWNDAPCNYELKWICQMAPRSSSES